MSGGLKLHEARKVKVIPVIIRNCLWAQMPFAKLQALPKDAKAVASWTASDDAFTDIANGIRLAAEELMETRD
jgi:hypothetical protein